MLKEALNEINPKGLSIEGIRGKGLMVGIEPVKDPQSKEPASVEAARIRSSLREKGVLIDVGGAFAIVLRIQPH